MSKTPQRQLFGTDGIRGRAGESLTPELALRAGFAFGQQAAPPDRRYNARTQPLVLLGRDPRLSSPMLAHALSSGLMLAGCDVVDMGIVPTPVVALMTPRYKAAGGVMITASHNPVPDNGIKFFGADGFKLGEAAEHSIEMVIRAAGQLAVPDQQLFGLQAWHDPQDDYLAWLQKSLKFKDGERALKIVLDCAHGATSELAPLAFRAAGHDVDAICAIPDGEKINVKCGATHLERVGREVRRTGADLGLAFDGDGDRVLAVDHQGKPVSGDKIIALFALNILRYKKQGRAVMTQMTNLGVEEALAARGVELLRTEVGDIQVMAGLRSNSLDLGGEQSGHIIMRDLAPGGDGILAGLRLAQILRSGDKSLAELAAQFPEYPQNLTNLKVADKTAWQRNKTLQKQIAAVQKNYPQVRFYLRPSGTEQLIRVLTEAKDRRTCDQANAEICALLG